MESVVSGDIYTSGSRSDGPSHLYASLLSLSLFLLILEVLASLFLFPAMSFFMRRLILAPVLVFTGILRRRCFFERLVGLVLLQGFLFLTALFGSFTELPEDLEAPVSCGALINFHWQSTQIQPLACWSMHQAARLRASFLFGLARILHHLHPRHWQGAVMDGGPLAIPYGRPTLMLCTQSAPSWDAFGIRNCAGRSPLLTNASHAEASCGSIFSIE
jgi:hypothetical protein